MGTLSTVCWICFELWITYRPSSSGPLVVQGPHYLVQDRAPGIWILLQVVLKVHLLFFLTLASCFSFHICSAVFIISPACWMLPGGVSGGPWSKQKCRNDWPKYCMSFKKQHFSSFALGPSCCRLRRTCSTCSRHCICSPTSVEKQYYLDTTKETGSSGI